jgi:hypothetical protein
MIIAVSSTCLDLSLIVRADFGLHTAVRALVLFMQNAIRTGATWAGTEEQLRSEVEIFRLAFVAHGHRSALSGLVTAVMMLTLFIRRRFPIGLRHTRVLDALISQGAPEGKPATLKICYTTSPGTTEGQDDTEEQESSSNDSVNQIDGEDTPSTTAKRSQTTEEDNTPASDLLLPSNSKHDSTLAPQELSIAVPVNENNGDSRKRIQSITQDQDVAMS